MGDAAAVKSPALLTIRRPTVSRRIRICSDVEKAWRTNQTEKPQDATKDFDD